MSDQGAPICPKCKQYMRYSQLMSDLDVDPYVCDPCDDEAIERANERAEWDYYHND